jgi:hypothetical protein
MTPGVVAVSVVVGPLGIAVGVVVVWLPLELAVLPEIVAGILVDGPLGTAIGVVVV